MLLYKMKSSRNSLDVFEFKEEDELTKMAANRISSKYSFLHCDPEDCANKKMPGVSDVQHDNSRSREQCAAVRYNKLDCGTDHSNCAFSESLLKDEPAGMTSVANQSTSERSPSSAIAQDDASNDGSSSENCFSGWDMGDGRTEVVFFPDYVDYHGAHYVNTVVIFSRRSVEVKTKTANGNQGILDIQMEIKDIVKIESLWFARYETGTINICFISKDGVQTDCFHNTSASEIKGLEFSTVDSDWYEKQEAIQSLDVRYKALWNILLDTGMEACTETSPNEKAMLLPRSYFPKFSKPFEEFIYPKGDPDAVSIGKRDVDLLRPDTFVNDTIIDFYIKYLKNKQKPEERCRFQFFNSFFFQKMANMGKDPSSAFDGKAAFQRVCKWTRKVNLLEKDFIFIPVNYNYHWSVIVICYFGEVVKYEDADKSDRVPCILHMDSIRGSHAGLHDLMRSYLWEEWKERQKEACEDLHTKFRNLKFVLLELPQQQNSYDCGLFLLHYVELFLEEVPVNFSIYNITSSSKFEEVETSMHFAYKTSTSTSFQHPDGIRPETSIFPYPSTDFKLESSVHQDAFEDTNTSPATSIYDSDDTSEVEVVKKCQAFGEISFNDKLDKPRCTSAENINCLAGCLASVPGQMQYAGESRTPVQASDHNYGAYPIITFQKSLPEFYHQENELLSYGGIHHKCLNDCPNPVSGEMLEVPDSECPTRMLEPDDNADLLESTSVLYCQRNYMQQDGIESVSELDCPKRMRLTTSWCKERT